MIRLVLISIPGIILAAGCASTPEAAGSPQGGYMERAETQTREDVTVTAAVPSAEESKAIFGSPLYRRALIRSIFHR
jgi:hypothetical protein